MIEANDSNEVPSIPKETNSIALEMKEMSKVARPPNNESIEKTTSGWIMDIFKYFNILFHTAYVKLVIKSRLYVRYSFML